MALSKQNHYNRNKRIHERFKELHNIERKRIDDVMDTLRHEFFLSEKRINDILRASPEESAGVDPNQVSLWEDEETNSKS